MENDNRSGGSATDTAAASGGSATDTAAAGGGGRGRGRLLVEESTSDVPNDRKRFEIDLEQDETTIVSWVQLLKDAGIPVNYSPHPPASPKRPKRFHQEDESKSQCSKIVLKKEKEEQTLKIAATKNTKMGHARVKSVTLTRHVSEKDSLNKGKIELPDLNVPYTVQAARISPTRIKDESCGMVNGSILENTILEMETMVAESRRVLADVEDADNSLATKSKLPWELKQKLETVARLAHSSQGRISDVLNMRLMSILGHWLKPRTLKRCLRDMVPSDLSPCGGDVIRFNQIKKEVVEMIKLRDPSMETKDGSRYETLGLHAAHKAKYSMDYEMEDKICDFYDIYVQGIDEIKSSEIRRFYIQLAALWPRGTMDNHGIRNAICRSKERRRTALQEKGHEKGKRKKSSNAGLDENLHEELVADSQRPVNDKNAPVLTFSDTVVPGTPELDQNLSAPAKRFSPPSARSA